MIGRQQLMLISGIVLSTLFVSSFGHARVTDDVSVLAAYTGSYLVDPVVKSANGCQKNFHALEVSLDYVQKAIVFVYSGGDPANTGIKNGVPYPWYVSRTDVTEGMFQRRRQVIKGTRVIIQYSTQDLLSGIWSPWGDDQAVIDFENQRSVDFFAACKFLKQ